MSNNLDKKIFNQSFLELDPSTIVHQIKEKGYFSFSSAINNDYLIQLVDQIETYETGINNNIALPVWNGDQFYFTHALSNSKHYFDLLISNHLRSIAKKKFGEYFRLKCHRYYETRFGHSMEWHADNVTNEGIVTEIDGLIFIIYINDVYDGEFQLVEGSNLDRKIEEGNYNYSNKFIDENYSSKVKTFSMPKGSIIIYDTFHIHRARPIINKKFIRKSIFFQIDASDKHSEKILISPDMFENREQLDPSLLTYLGFGKKSEFPAVPVTNESNLPLHQVFKLIYKLLIASIKIIYRRLLKNLLSHDQLMKYYNNRRKKLDN